MKPRDPRHYIRKRHSLANQNNRPANDTDRYIASVRERLERIRARSKERLLASEQLAESQSASEEQSCVHKQVTKSVQDVHADKPKEASLSHPTTQSHHHFSPSARGSVKELIARRDSSRASSDTSLGDVEKVLENLDRAKSEDRNYIQNKRSISREQPIADHDAVFNSTDKNNSLQRQSVDRKSECKDSDHFSPHAPSSPELSVNNPYVSGDTCASDSDYGSSSSTKDLDSNHKPQAPVRPPDLVASTFQDQSTNSFLTQDNNAHLRKKPDQRDHFDRTQSVFVKSDSTDSIIRPKNHPTSNLSRSEKAQSWSLGDLSPVPPPRKNRGSLKAKSPPKAKQPLLEIQSFSPKKSGLLGKTEPTRPVPLTGNLSTELNFISETSRVPLSISNPVLSTENSPVTSVKQRSNFLHVDTGSETLSSTQSTPSVSPSRSPSKPPRRGSGKRRAPPPPSPPQPLPDPSTTSPRITGADHTDLDHGKNLSDQSAAPVIQIDGEQPIPPPRKRSSIRNSRGRLSFDTEDKHQTSFESETIKPECPPSIDDRPLPAQVPSNNCENTAYERITLPSTNSTSLLSADVDNVSRYQPPDHKASFITAEPTTDTRRTVLDTVDTVDTNMEAESRKQELERMRHGLFGRHEEPMAPTPTNTVNTGGSNNNTTATLSNTYTTDLTNSNVTITNTADSHTQKASTVISIVDEGNRSPTAISYESSLAKTVLNISNESPKRSPAKADEFEDGFYDEDIVLKPADGTLSKKTKHNSKIVLDLDEHAYRREFSMPDRSSQVLPDHTEGVDFDMPHTSKIVLTLDEDMYASESNDHDEPLVETLVDIDSGVNDADLIDNSGSERVNLDNAGLQSGMYLDVDPQQYSPGIEYTALPLIPSHGRPFEEDIQTTYLPPPTTSTSMELFLTNPSSKQNSNELTVNTGGGADMLDSLNISRTSSERDSDLSDNEGTFQATFEPSRHFDSYDEDTYAIFKEANHDDSGIVLVSYQQKDSEADTPAVELKSVTPKVDDSEAVKSFIDFFASGPSTPKKDIVKSTSEPKKASSSMSLTLKQPNYASNVLVDTSDKPVMPTLVDPLQPDIAPSQSPADMIDNSVIPPLPDTPPPVLGTTDLSVISTSRGPPPDTSLSAVATVNVSPDPVGSWPDSTAGKDKDILSHSVALEVDSTQSHSDNVKDLHSLMCLESNSSVYTASPESSVGKVSQQTGPLVILGVDPRVDTHTPPPTMDPVTGLKKTGLSSPVEKAIQFVERTEPVIRIKKKNSKDNEPPDPERVALYQEIAHERHSIMNELRIKPKRMTTWVADEDGQYSGKTESERKYEERKKRLSQPDASPVTPSSPLSTPASDSFTSPRTPNRTFPYGKPRKYLSSLSPTLPHYI